MNLKPSWICLGQFVLPVATVPFTIWPKVELSRLFENWLPLEPLPPDIQNVLNTLNASARNWKLLCSVMRKSLPSDISATGTDCVRISPVRSGVPRVGAKFGNSRKLMVEREQPGTLAL